MPAALCFLLCALPRARALLLPPGCKSRQNRLGRLRSEIRTVSILDESMFPVTDIAIDPKNEMPMILEIFKKKQRRTSA